MKLSELASILALEVLPESDADVDIHSVASPRTALPGTLVFAEDEAALAAGFASGASAVLTRSALASGTTPSKPLVLARHPKLAFARAARLLHAPSPYT